MKITIHSEQAASKWTPRHRFTHRRSSTAVVLGTGLGALGLLVSACGGSTPSSATSGNTTTTSNSIPTTINMAYTAPVADQLLPLIAKQAGLFAKYGVNVNITYLSATAALDGLVGGKIQMSVFDSPEPEVAVAAGQQIKWIAEWEHHANLYLLGGPGITSVKDLAGKAIAETVAGSTTAVLTQVALNQAGVLSSAHLEPVGNVGATLSAFLAGSVQATIAGPPNQTVLLSKVPGSSILVDYTKSFPWVGGGLAASTAWTSKNVAATVDVVKALQDAVVYFKSHEAESVAVIEKATHADSANATAGYQAMLSIIDATSSIVPSVTVETDVLKAMAPVSPATAKLTGASVIDTTYAQAASKG
ncbi:MAG: ABC transporter substrate-binding protein [Acidimicrobiaceae bacterium]|nr:ABC transporter substrate-binding protein [Acidimicrobiaceae bacterium]